MHAALAAARDPMAERLADHDPHALQCSLLCLASHVFVAVANAPCAMRGVRHPPAATRCVSPGEAGWQGWGVPEAGPQGIAGSTCARQAGTVVAHHTHTACHSIYNCPASPCPAATPGTTCPTMQGAPAPACRQTAAPACHARCASVDPSSPEPSPQSTAQSAVHGDGQACLPLHVASTPLISVCMYPVPAGQHVPVQHRRGQLPQLPCGH